LQKGLKRDHEGPAPILFLRDFSFFNRLNWNTMQTPKDKYDLTRISTSGKPGFELFHDEKNEKHFFVFNGADGTALLFSQAYSSSKSRDRGIEAVKGSLGRDDRVDRKKEGSKHYFILKAGNHLEIARSRLFDSKAEMEQALQFLASQERTPGKGMASSRSASEEEAAARYMFQLYFRKAAEGEPYRCTIEFPLENKKNTFHHFDMDLIARFIREQVPEDVIAPGHFTTPGPAKEYGLQIVEQGDVVVKSIFTNADMLEARMEADKKEGLGYEFQVFARSLEKGMKTLVGEKRGVTAKDGIVAVPIMTNALEPGAYRLEARLRLHKKDGDADLQGSRLVQIFRA
jgi:uncharacterized protein